MTADWQVPFRKLQHGMSYEEVVSIVGEPDRSSASEKEIHTYYPVPGVEVRVIMAPSLAGVYAQTDGQFIDLVGPPVIAERILASCRPHVGPPRSRRVRARTGPTSARRSSSATSA